MSIRKWHHGKLIVLWSWGIFLSAVALTDVKTAHAERLTLFRLCELLFVLCLLITLSIVTWIWLGGKEEPTTTAVPKDKSHDEQGEE
jgi:ammonia channel protein AmtB